MLTRIPTTNVETVERYRNTRSFGFAKDDKTSAPESPLQKWSYVEPQSWTWIETMRTTTVVKPRYGKNKVECYRREYEDEN
jgi:hypothetical protein